jgi:hypothetical protein
MAQTTKTAAEQQMLTVIANVRAKFAELDALDSEFADLDAAMPMGDGGEQFNLLSEKREELETEIRSMRERVQLISEWEKFKGSGWSDEVQTELNALDSQFSAIADGASDAGMGAPIMPDMPMAPETPMTPEAPISPAAPVAPEVPAVDATADLSAAPATEPMPDEAIEAPPAEADPLAAPIASSKNAQIKEKTNYQLQEKKGSSTSAHLKKGDTTMANTSNLSLKEKLAEAKTKRDAIQKEAKTRVASAYTIAKTLLPSAPASVQESFTASLLAGNSTKVLKAALRQTAINAHYQKLAETFKEVHKMELNDLLEDPSVLNTEKKSVESELKGEPKSAGKVADDRKENGPQEGTYDDGRDGSEPKELDASKAAERPDAGEKPGQTQNLSDGKTEKAAGAKTACVGADCTGCKNADCKGKKANAKKADGEMPEEAPAPAAEAPVEEAAAPEAPAEAEAPTDLPPAVPENPEAEAAEILTDEKKNVLEEKITEAQDAISAIEQEILSEGDEELDLAKLEGEEDALGDFEGDDLEGAEEEFTMEALPEGEEGDGEELDFAKVFDPEGMDEKAASLANEGEEKSAAGEDDFFTPSAASNLEASMDDDGMGDMHDMFSLQGSDGDPLASLIAGLKSAAEVAGMDIVPSSTGEAADHFESDEAAGDDRDNETDHDGNLFFEALDSITPEAQGAKRTTQDSTNELELPKAAAKATLKKIRTAGGETVKAPRFDIGTALFGTDED